MFANSTIIPKNQLREILKKCYNNILNAYDENKTKVKITLTSGFNFKIPIGYYSNPEIPNEIPIDYEELYDMNPDSITKFKMIEFRKEQKKPIKTIISAIQDKIENKRPCYLKIQMPCGFGKTVIAASLIQMIKKKTVIILNTTSLVNQWNRTLDEYGISYELSKNNVESTIESFSINKPDVVLVIFKHFSNLDFCDFIYKNYSFLILDESHKYNLNNYNGLKYFLNFYPIPIGIFLTATPRKENDLYCNHLLSFCKKNEINKKLIIIKTQNSGTIDEDTKKKMKLISMKIDRWKVLLNNLIEFDSFRLGQIFQTIKNLYGVLFCRTIIITKSRDVMEKIYTRLIEENYQNVFKGDAKVKEETAEMLKDLIHQERFILVTTFQYSGTGLDLPNLDSMLICSCNWNQRDIIQAAGRISREHEDSLNRYIFLYTSTSLLEYRNYIETQINAAKRTLINHEWELCDI